MTGDPQRLLLAGGAVLLWLVLTVVTALRAAGDRRRAAASAGVGGDWLIVTASQTGFADSLAEMTAAAVRAAGSTARIAPLGAIDAATLATAGRALFIVSTTGEGDAPDSAIRFVRRTLRADAVLPGLRYGLMALGDHAYRDFCGFGRALDGWLRRSGAEPLFDAVEVDNGDAGAIRHWQHQVALLTGGEAQPDWTPPAFDRWSLSGRRHLNPGSPGGPVWRLAFEPVGHTPDWRAGDIAEIGLPDGDGSREYSIASLPSEGRLELLIRRMVRPDGTPGLASGWLVDRLAVGDEVGLRTRTNRAFHGPDAATPLILIGNGTGLAGLRAHLMERRPDGRTWLLFGERTAAHDAFLDDELQRLRREGVLTRLDRAFSRDAGDGRYVQALIAEQAAELAGWIADGATILVCGSLEGMAPGVHAALEQALGADALAGLAESGRYRRDVY